MNEFQTVLVIVASIGFNMIVVYGSIFSWLRDLASSKSDFLGELISCPMCFGLWSGLCFGFAYGLNPFLLAFSVSLFSWLTASLVGLVLSASSYFEQLEYINAVEKQSLFIEGEEL